MRIHRLRFENLTLEGQGPIPVFDQVNFEFPLDGVHWIRGETGSGKSSLLKLLAGLREPSRGSYLINDSDVATMSFEELVPFRRKIGYSFEYGGLISNRSIRQNLMLPFFYHRDLSATEAEARVAEFCHRFRLDAVKDLRPAQVSGGARKAACVARSLILHPELLLLDHPTAGLDPREVRTLSEMIRHQRADCGLRHVFITGAGGHEELTQGLGAGTLRIENGGITLDTPGAGRSAA